MGGVFPTVGANCVRSRNCHSEPLGEESAHCHSEPLGEESRFVYFYFALLEILRYRAG